MSPGTIYPLLHSLQKKGYLSVALKREGSRAWREYSATKEGKRALNAAKRKLRELFHELIDSGLRPQGGPSLPKRHKRNR